MLFVFVAGMLKFAWIRKLTLVITFSIQIQGGKWYLCYVVIEYYTNRDFHIGYLSTEDICVIIFMFYHFSMRAPLSNALSEQESKIYK